jgi:hypothetical protein
VSLESQYGNSTQPTFTKHIKVTLISLKYHPALGILRDTKKSAAMQAEKERLTNEHGDPPQI